MDKKADSKDMYHFDVFNSFCQSLLYDVAQCISESDLISLMPIALEGKPGRGSFAYEQLLDANKREMLEYWQTVCTELQLKTKYNILSSLMVKYANSKDPKWRPKLNDVEECLNKYRNHTLIMKKQKLEEGLRDLQEELRKTENESAKQIEIFDEDNRFQLSQIKRILRNKILNLDQLITERHEQILQISNT